MPGSVYHYHQQIKPKFFNYYLVSEKIQELHVKKQFRKVGNQLIYIEFKKLGYTIGKNKVRYLMGQLGFLQSKVKKWQRYNSFKGIWVASYPMSTTRTFKSLDHIKRQERI
jgi:hypothetical protein